ncbi:MAG: hypothetical protein GY903_22825 [Fuerstiella sp.]|nr:hypothetical protein [Fuerstiella sp.]MCP4857327.1 hypothetical protein [Fuerstiella sp.]
MREHENEIEALGIKVVIVTFEAGLLAQAYIRETNLRWALLVDEPRDLYSAYGMERGRWWDILGPAAWWVYAKLLVRGRRLRNPSGDVKQLGGDVLIDPAGIVRLHHVGAGPADRPRVSSLLDVVCTT